MMQYARIAFLIISASALTHQNDDKAMTKPKLMSSPSSMSLAQKTKVGSSMKKEIKKSRQDPHPMVMQDPKTMQDQEEVKMIEVEDVEDGNNDWHPHIPGTKKIKKKIAKASAMPTDWKLPDSMNPMKSSKPACENQIPGVPDYMAAFVPDAMKPPCPGAASGEVQGVEAGATELGPGNSNVQASAQATTEDTLLMSDNQTRLMIICAAIILLVLLGSWFAGSSHMDSYEKCESPPVLSGVNTPSRNTAINRERMQRFQRRIESHKQKLEADAARDSGAP